MSPRNPALPTTPTLQVHTSALVFYMGFGNQIQFLMIKRQALYPVGYRPSPHLWFFPLKNLSFQLHWLILILNEVLFRSTYSHKKHKYLVTIPCRWWQCSLSQSRPCSDAGVVTCAPWATCFYKSTSIGIQQPSLYCCSICFCANPSWVQ